MGGIKKNGGVIFITILPHFHYFMSLLLHFHNFDQKSEVLLLRISLGNASVVTC